MKAYGSRRPRDATVVRGARMWPTTRDRMPQVGRHDGRVVFLARLSLCRNRRPPLRAASPLVAGPSDRPLLSYLPALPPEPPLPPLWTSASFFPLATPLRQSPLQVKQMGRAEKSGCGHDQESSSAAHAAVLCRNCLGRCRRRAPKLSARQARIDGALQKNSRGKLQRRTAATRRTASLRARSASLPPCTRKPSHPPTVAALPTPPPHTVGSGLVYPIRVRRPPRSTPFSELLLGGFSRTRSAAQSSFLYWFEVVALDVDCRTSSHRHRRARRGGARYPPGTLPTHGPRGERRGLHVHPRAPAAPRPDRPCPCGFLGGAARAHAGRWPRIFPF